MIRAIGSSSGSTGAGSDIFGYRPSSISLPNPLKDIKKAVPNYSELVNLLSGNLLSSLQGPSSALQSFYGGKLNALNQQKGVGGSGFADTAAQLGIYDRYRSEQEKAIDDLLKFLGVQDATATLDPGIEANISDRNSLMAAAPNPAAYAQWLQEQFQKQQALFNPMGQGTPGVSYSSQTPTASAPRPRTIPFWQQPIGTVGDPGGGRYSGTGGAIPSAQTSVPAPPSQEWFPYSSPQTYGTPSVPSIMDYSINSPNPSPWSNVVDFNWGDVGWNTTPQVGTPQLSPTESILRDAGIPIYDYA